jgi:hypothetical protein
VVGIPYIAIHSRDVSTHCKKSGTAPLLLVNKYLRAADNTNKYFGNKNQ